MADENDEIILSELSDDELCRRCTTTSTTA